jgi:hypothetical protein
VDCGSATPTFLGRSDEKGWWKEVVVEEVDADADAHKGQEDL